MFFDADVPLVEVKSFLSSGCQNSPGTIFFQCSILEQGLEGGGGRADLGNFFENVEILHKKANHLSGIIRVNYSPKPHFYGLIIIFLVSIILVGWAIWAIVNFIIFSFSAIVHQKSFTRPHWRTVETAVQMSSRIFFVFARKLTKFGSRLMVNRTLRVLFVSLLSQVQTKYSHHVCVTLRVRLHVRFVRWTRLQKNCHKSLIFFIENKLF